MGDRDGQGVDTVAAGRVAARSRAIGSLFRVWLEHVLSETGCTLTELGNQAGVDERTIARLRDGETRPLFETASRLILAVQCIKPHLSAALADHLVRGYANLQRSDAGDFDQDGDITGHDLLIGTARFVRLAGTLPELVIQALGQRHISNSTALQMHELQAELRDILNGLTAVVDALNDGHSRFTGGFRRSD